MLVVKPEVGQGSHYNYKIHSNASHFFVDESWQFPSIAALLQYYQHHDGLRMRLGDPVLRQALEERERDKWEIHRDSIEKVKLLGSGNFGEVNYYILIFRFLLTE